MIVTFIMVFINIQVSSGFPADVMFPRRHALGSQCKYLNTHQGDRLFKFGENENGTDQPQHPATAASVISRSAPVDKRDLIQLHHSTTAVRGSGVSEPPTFSHGFDCDDFTVVAMACRSDSNHPDAVLAVPAQVGDAVKEDIWSCFKLTTHLGTNKKNVLVITGASGAPVLDAPVCSK